MIAPQKQIYKSIREMSLFASKPTHSEVYIPEKKHTYRLPLFIDPYFIPIERNRLSIKEGRLDLNDYLVKNPGSTFLIRVTGDSMIRAGINSGDILVVDKSVEPVNGKVVVASVNNKLLVKRLRFTEDETLLISENAKYEPIKITHDDEFDIWGVVTSVVKTI